MSEREEWITNKKKNFENPLGDIVSGLLKPLLSKKNKTEAIFITSFNRIFSDEIASKVKFLKINSSKTGKTTLYLEVPSRYMLEVTHLKDVMIDKISTYFGYKAVDEIIFRRK